MSKNISDNKLSRLPAHARMNEAIRKAVRCGDLKPGEGIQSERKLAERYGIAYLSVRSGIQKLVEEGLLYKIPQKGIFVAQVLPERESNKKIALYLPGLNSSIWFRTLAGVESEVNSREHRLYFINGSDDGNVRHMEKLLKFLGHTKVDGLLLVGQPSKEEYYELKSLNPNMKIIIIGGNLHTPKADCVKADNEGGARLATEHLIQRGHKNIAYIEPSTSSEQAAKRRKGYLEAMKSHGLQARAYSGWEKNEEKQKITDQLASQDSDIDAIFCFSDIVAMQAIKLLKKHGLAAPDNLSVVGFSNLSEAEYYDPPISSVDTNHFEMGRVAAEELIAQLSGKASSHFEAITTARLIIRESSQI